MVDIGPADDLTDDDLLRLFRSGDTDAFDVLFDRHHRRVYGFARFILRDDSGAEEIMQETFVAVARAVKTYEPRGGFRAWIMTIARNRSLNRAESERARREVFAAEMPDSPSREAPPPARAEAREHADLIRRRMDELPPRQREALTLHAVEGMGYREVAEALDVPTNTVKTLIHRARASLAAALEDEGGAKRHGA